MWERNSGKFQGGTSIQTLEKVETDVFMASMKKQLQTEKNYL